MGYPLEVLILPAVLFNAYPSGMNLEEIAEVYRRVGFHDDWKFGYIGMRLGLATKKRIPIHGFLDRLHDGSVYNYRAQKGRFNVFGETGFLWYKRRSRYYFDPVTLDNIHASMRTNRKFDAGYVDLVFTAEVVRYHRGDLLRRDATIDSWAKFLQEHLYSKERVDKAIWDSHTSLFAEKEGMNVTELLRMRSLGGVYFSGKERE